MPIKPYPYREEEVTYSNPAAKIQLAATITIPPGKGRFPAVLLMAGSGPNDRDESIMGHKPFLVLADYLMPKETGAIAEYAEIEETISLVAMERVASWILKQTS